MNQLSVCIFVFIILFSIITFFYIVFKKVIDKYSKTDAETSIEMEFEFFKIFKIKIKSNQSKRNKNNAQNE